MTTIKAALEEAASMAASRIVDSEDILEFSLTVSIKHSQGTKNVEMYAIALADGSYSVESITDVESIHRGEVTL